MPGKRPYVDFQEVKEKCPLPEVLDILGLLDRFEQKGETWQGVCPLPGHQHGPAPNDEQFKVDFKEGCWVWYCFGDCHQGGDVVAFIKEYLGYSDAHARLWFAQHFDDRLTLSKPKQTTRRRPLSRKPATTPVPTASEVDRSGQPRPRAPESTDTTAGLKPLRWYYNLDSQVPYLTEHYGIAAETLAQYEVGMCRKGLLTGYIAFPIAHPQQPELLAGYVGRWPGEDFNAEHPRWKFPDELPRHRVLFGWRQALATPAGAALALVQGPLAVLTLAGCGLPAVGLLTTALSDAQAELLGRSQRRLLVCFHADERGCQASRQAVEQLSQHTWVRVVSVPTGWPLDRLARDEVAQLLASVK